MPEFNASEFFKQLNLSDNFFYTLTEIIKRGDNKLVQKRYAESMVIDSGWIDTVENYLYYVEKIVKKPKLFIKEDGIVVPVEKAKKTDSETIRHLSANSNLIRSIDEKGNVIPIKVLTKEINEDAAIYENRVVNTLIKRLSDFIDQKFLAITQQVDAYDTTALELDSDFELGETRITFNLSLKMKERAKTNLVQKKNYELLERLENIRKRLTIIKASAFCKMLANTKPVQPPIMKTNILKLDVDYKNAYSLWLFISAFTQIGFSVQLDEKNQPVDGGYYDDLTSLIAVSIKTVLENNAERADAYRDIAFKKSKPKKFRVKKSEILDVGFSVSEVAEGEGQVNQFYYEKIKSLVKKSEESRRLKNSLEVKEKKNINFRSFFKEMNNLNNSIYKEILNVTEADEEAASGQGTLKKELAYKKQAELYKRMKTLTKLKLADLDKTLKEESAQLVKLEKIKSQLDEAKAKQNKKRPRKVSPKSLQNLKNTKAALLEGAAFREMQMLSELRAKQAAAAEREAENELVRKRKKAAAVNISDLTPEETDKYEL